jgi:hypothetical protein
MRSIDPRPRLGLVSEAMGMEPEGGSGAMEESMPGGMEQPEGSGAMEESMPGDTGEMP